MPHAVTTLAVWPSRALRCGYVGFFLRGLGRTIQVDYRGGLRARMLSTASGRVVSRAIRAWRPERRTLAISFARRLLGSATREYVWFAYTRTTNAPCPLPAGDPDAAVSYSDNDDRTPNRRPLVHRLDGVVPLARG